MKYLICSFCFLFSCSHEQPAVLVLRKNSNVTTPLKLSTKAELLVLLPEGHQLLDFDFGDLDGDGDRDCLAAYRLIEEDEHSSELVLRPLIVYFTRSREAAG